MNKGKLITSHRLNKSYFVKISSNLGTNDCLYYLLKKEQIIDSSICPDTNMIFGWSRAGRYKATTSIKQVAPNSFRRYGWIKSKLYWFIPFLCHFNDGAPFSFMPMPFNLGTHILYSQLGIHSLFSSHFNTLDLETIYSSLILYSLVEAIVSSYFLFKSNRVLTYSFGTVGVTTRYANLCQVRINVICCSRCGELEA